MRPQLKNSGYKLFIHHAEQLFAPGCKSNYYKDEHVPVFKLPLKPDQLRHAWLQALHREDIEDLKLSMFV